MFSSMAGATNETETAYFSNAHEFTSDFSRVLPIFSVLCSDSKTIACPFVCYSILNIELALNPRFIFRKVVDLLCKNLLCDY